MTNANLIKKNSLAIADPSEPMFSAEQRQIFSKSGFELIKDLIESSLKNQESRSVQLGENLLYLTADKEGMLSFSIEISLAFKVPSTSSVKLITTNS